MTLQKDEGFLKNHDIAKINQIRHEIEFYFIQKAKHFFNQESNYSDFYITF